VLPVRGCDLDEAVRQVRDLVCSSDGDCSFIGVSLTRVTVKLVTEA
jgi:hypothetical protein